MWMGHRPSLPNSLPVLGASGARPDVIYAFGHGHVGMTSAPMTGKIVADLVAGRPPSIDIGLFLPAGSVNCALGEARANRSMTTRYDRERSRAPRRVRAAYRTSWPERARAAADPGDIETEGLGAGDVEAVDEMKSTSSFGAPSAGATRA